VVVQKGLQRGERYVVSASERLSDGTPVTLRD
jgi:hypothetical protein